MSKRGVNVCRGEPSNPPRGETAGRCERPGEHGLAHAVTHINRQGKPGNARPRRVVEQRRRHRCGFHPWRRTHPAASTSMPSSPVVTRSAREATARRRSAPVERCSSVLLRAPRMTSSARSTRSFGAVARSSSNATFTRGVSVTECRLCLVGTRASVVPVLHDQPRAPPLAAPHDRTIRRAEEQPVRQLRGREAPRQRPGGASASWLPTPSTRPAVGRSSASTSARAARSDSRPERGTPYPSTAVGRTRSLSAPTAAKEKLKPYSTS